MAKIKTKYICQECGYETAKWLGRCPGCGNFSSFQEELIQELKQTKKPPASLPSAKTLDSINTNTELRAKTKISELDRVLGGGIVQGSLTLIGGDPGIGKSTLILQICQNLGESGRSILYISGEESAGQIKLRASRLGITTEKLLILTETSINTVEAAVIEIQPDIVIIDSIQTMFLEDLSSAPGSVTQVRECTAKLMRIGKISNISVIIVGHVTKDGSIAGPRILEHMVDTVLYFEGERMASYRILRAVKNRFGSTNEIGVFEMTGGGLREIRNPSEFMLSGRPIGAAGSAITCSIEGTRPILTEVQALTSYTTFNMPRRMATGMDFNRVIMLIAVLEKKTGIQLGSYDCYVNLAGGIRVGEPALDAAVITAIASSYKNKPANPYALIFGEAGLAGEIRAVSMSQKRAAEAVKLGFKKIILPMDNAKEAKSVPGAEIIGVSSVSELLEAVLHF